MQMLIYGIESQEKTYIIKIVEIIYEMCYFTLIENCS